MNGAHDPPSGTLDRAFEGAAPPRPGDPLSDVLRTVRLRGALFFLVDASSPWCIDVPRAREFAGIILPGARHVVSYHVAVRGGGLAGVAGQQPVAFGPGDVIVFPHGDAYLMSSAPGVAPELTPEQTLRFFRDMAAGRLPLTVREGGGREPAALFICGFLGCDLSPFNPLLSALPGVLRVTRPGGGEDLLDRLIALAMTEMGSARPGGESIRLGLCELMFVEVLRRHLGSASAGSAGWLAGLRDPVVGRALALVHAQPARAWTLVDLAREAAVSRTVLAQRFAARLGQPPMHYLALWRMQLAARLLADGGEKVASIAERVGFRSEAAFSRGFKRATGLSPAAWRRRQAGSGPPPDPGRAPRPPAPP